VPLIRTRQTSGRVTNLNIRLDLVRYEIRCLWRQQTNHFSYGSTVLLQCEMSGGHLLDCMKQVSSQQNMVIVYSIYLCTQLHKHQFMKIFKNLLTVLDINH